MQNNIIGAFLKLEQLLTTNDAYTKDDIVIAGLPSADQLSLLINASALSEGQVAPAASSVKKVSVSSMCSEGIVEEESSALGQENVSPIAQQKEETTVDIPKPT